MNIKQISRISNEQIIEGNCTQLVRIEGEVKESTRKQKKAKGKHEKVKEKQENKKTENWCTWKSNQCRQNSLLKNRLNLSD